MAGNNCNVKCKWREAGKFLVNPDGQVWPCCYLANAEYFKKMTNDDPTIDYPRGPMTYIIQEYNKYEPELNAFNNSIDRIFMHKWWRILEKSWDDPDLVDRRCVRYCSEGDDTPR